MGINKEKILKKARKLDWEAIEEKVINNQDILKSFFRIFLYKALLGKNGFLHYYPIFMSIDPSGIDEKKFDWYVNWIVSGREGRAGLASNGGGSYAISDELLKKDRGRIKDILINNVDEIGAYGFIKELKDGLALLENESIDIHDLDFAELGELSLGKGSLREIADMLKKSKENTLEKLVGLHVKQYIISKLKEEYGVIKSLIKNGDKEKIDSLWKVILDYIDDFAKRLKKNALDPKKSLV